MDENDNPIIKNTGDINIDTTTYFQEQTQNITQNGEYIYEQNENGAWHLELKPQDSIEPTDININIPPPTITSQIQNNGYYKFNDNWNGLVSGTSSDYNLNINVNSNPLINIKYVKQDYYSDIYEIKGNFIYNNTGRYINVPSKCSLIFFDPTPNNYYQINYITNQTTSTTSTSVYENSYYYIINKYDTNIILLDENRNEVLNIIDIYTDTYATRIRLYKNCFNIILN